MSARSQDACRDMFAHSAFSCQERSSGCIVPRPCESLLIATPISILRSGIFVCREESMRFRLLVVCLITALLVACGSQPPATQAPTAAAVPMTVADAPAPTAAPPATAAAAPEATQAPAADATEPPP